MASKKQTRNLWAVNYRVGRDAVDFEKLWILAPSAKVAESKARRFARSQRGFKQVRVSGIRFEGEIDVL